MTFIEQGPLLRPDPADFDLTATSVDFQDYELDDDRFVSLIERLERPECCCTNLNISGNLIYQFDTIQQLVKRCPRLKFVDCRLTPVLMLRGGDVRVLKDLEAEYVRKLIWLPERTFRCEKVWHKLLSVIPPERRRTIIKDVTLAHDSFYAK